MSRDNTRRGVHLSGCNSPGHPEKTVKGGTTVSGGSTVLSRILQQSFNTQRRPCAQKKQKKGLMSVKNGRYRSFCSISLNLAASSLLLTTSEHDFHVTTLPQEQKRCRCFKLCLINYLAQTGKSKHLFVVTWVKACDDACFETHYNTVLSNVNVGANLCCIDHTVLFDEDVISNVQREKCHSKGSKENVLLA